MLNNPILQNLNQSKISQMVSQIKSFGNPQAMLENSPQYKEVMKYVNQNGGDPQKAFYKLAKEMGIDPEEILMLLK